MKFAWSHIRRASAVPLLISGRHTRPLSTDSEILQERESGDDGQPGTSQQHPQPTPDAAMSLAANDQKTARRDVESCDNARMSNIRQYLMEEVDTARAAPPLTAYCFMTGFMDAVAFSAVYVWCAFQTGNTVQLSLALARLFNGSHDYSFHLGDQQALCSVLTFILGAFLGRIGDKIGPKTRLWMTLGTFVQTLFTMSAALTLWKSASASVAPSRGSPAWMDTLSFVGLGFMSASMGLQGIMGKRLNTQFTTTVVLTTTWCELMTEPQLFYIHRLVPSRDHKAMAIFFLFLGGLISRALLDRIGSSGTLGIGAGVRLVITLWWLLAPAKKATK